MGESRVPAVVLAGGSGDDPVAAAQGKPVKALCTVGGKPIVRRVVEALAAGGVTRIVVATAPGAVEEVREALGDAAEVVGADGPRFTDTLRAGMRALGNCRRALLATGDLPALSGEAVRHFLDEALATGAELVYATVRADALERPYARGKRVKVKLREGEFVGGNLVMASPGLVERALRLIEQAFSARKSAVGLARLLGLSFVLRLALGLLDIPAIVRRAQRLLDCTAAVVVSPYPGVCFDMDNPDDLEIAEVILRAHRH